MVSALETTVRIFAFTFIIIRLLFYYYLGLFHFGFHSMGEVLHFIGYVDVDFASPLPLLTFPHLQWCRIGQHHWSRITSTCS